MATLAVDWDNTLIDYRTKEWLPGAREALSSCLMGKRKVVIHSCTANWPEGLASIEAKLRSDGFLGHPLLTIHTGPGKPIADLYVDDKGLRFDGDWPAVLRHPALAK